jgi:excisionase family DNA binding protein
MSDQMLLTVTEAAQRLSISRSHFYQLLQAGVIASVTIGRSRRISVSALQDYVGRLQDA